ncbi:MAG: sigma-70 family RNA polymerase sigma factor [Phycisphaerales bacterium]|jgi:RNA polymerase sigma factor (sigma-70 family)
MNTPNLNMIQAPLSSPRGRAHPNLTASELGKDPRSTRLRHPAPARTTQEIFPLQSETLSAEAEKELGWKLVNEKCASSRERLVRANLGLVVSIAKQFTARGMILADLIQEGNIGLIHAADGFDPARGVRFGTYATSWIKHAIRRSLLGATQTVRVPPYMTRLIAQWKAAFNAFEQETGAAPTCDELAISMELPLQVVQEIGRAAQQAEHSTEAARDSSGTLVNLRDTIADTHEPRADARSMGSDDVTKLREWIRTIDEKQRRMISMRFGLDGSTPLSLDQVASKLSASRESVRQRVSELLLNAAACFAHSAT